MSQLQQWERISPSFLQGLFYAGPQQITCSSPSLVRATFLTQGIDSNATLFQIIPRNDVFLVFWASLNPLPPQKSWHMKLAITGSKAQVEIYKLHQERLRRLLVPKGQDPTCSWGQFASACPRGRYFLLSFAMMVLVVSMSAVRESENQNPTNQCT